MVGQTVSHYRVLQQVGSGGMGVVYKAEDERLKRIVALKFLPPESTADEDARRRFAQEARAASSLDHPNICTIYDIDTAPDGRMFLVMAYYDGETLKTLVGRGPLGVNEAVGIAIQVCRGLMKAHAAGIVHRDIKPANLMLTKDGVVKILDFGIAKLSGETGLTRTGVTPGTVSYMSPEQLRGDAVDSRTDLWALAVVLYQMIAGELPFRGDAPAHAILNEEPRDLDKVRPGTPARLSRIVARALEKRPDARHESAEQLLADLVECRSTLSAAQKSPDFIVTLQALRRSRIAVAALLLLFALAVWSAWSWSRAAESRRARQQSVQQIEQHADAGEWEAAYVLTRQLEASAPGDPALAELWPRIAWTTSIPSSPSGARVLRRAYSDTEGGWEELGVTPLENIRFPFGLSRLRFELDGYRTLDRTLGSGILVGTTLQVVNPFTLEPEHTLAENQVRVSGWREVVAGEAMDLRDFTIGRYEVTNREYKAFVDAGGYRRREFWEHPIVMDGRVISWDAAAGLLVDKTGRPGPSTWEAGDYPEGQDDYPVGGVSWYEAAAYARYVGQELPTVHHWRRAFAPDAAAWMLPASNLDGGGPARVGQFQGMSWPGTFDMAGNVREWCFNAAGGQRFILGGGWNDPYYLAQNMNYAQPPFDRSATNGFRVASTSDDEREREWARASSAPAASAPAWLRVPVPVELEISTRRMLSDELFSAYRNLFAYDPAPLNEKIEATVESRHWDRQRVSFDAAYGGERMILYLFLPRMGSPPYQTVVYWPGSAALNLQSIDQYQVHLDFVLKTGRAVAFPVYNRTFERGDRSPLPPAATAAFRDIVVQWIKDLRRSIDYLETRPDIDRDALSFYGHSWGGANAPIALSLEPRLKTAVLYVAGLYQARFLPEIDAASFLPRVRVPVLMLNGELDNIFPLETNAKVFFDRLGTPAADKRLVVAPGGHFVPGPVLIKETLQWLDRQLGVP